MILKQIEQRRAAKQIEHARLKPRNRAANAAAPFERAGACSTRKLAAGMAGMVMVGVAAAAAGKLHGSIDRFDHRHRSDDGCVAGQAVSACGPLLGGQNARGREIL